MTQQEHQGERESAEEQALIARSQKGDRDAFNQLVQRYQSGAYALALRMLGDPDAAADVTQDAFFSAYRSVASFRGTAFRPWLFRIVSNGCFDYWRAQKRHPATSLEALTEGERDAEAVDAPGDSRLPQAMSDPSWDPERVALSAELVEQIQTALLRLPPEQRLALILSDIQGMAYDEISRIMGTSLGTVKSRISRARGHLRQLLTRQGELFQLPYRPGNERRNEHR